MRLTKTAELSLARTVVGTMAVPVSYTHLMVGAAVPPEVYASGVLGCAFAVITGTGTATAVALALPVSVFLQVWRNFCYAVPGAFACKKIETALANRDLAKANLYHLTVVPLSIGIPSALLVFCSLFFGADLINNALNAIPQFVMDGLDVYKRQPRERRGRHRRRRPHPAPGRPRHPSMRQSPRCCR